MALHQLLQGTPARACDLSPCIHNSFTPEFLEALIGIAKGKQAANRANPVSTLDSPGMQLRVEHRQAEMARLVGVIRAATMLTEPEEFDLLDLEIAASDLSAYLDEDMGQMERSAIAIVRGGPRA